MTHIINHAAIAARLRKENQMLKARLGRINVMMRLAIETGEFNIMAIISESSLDLGGDLPSNFQVGHGFSRPETAHDEHLFAGH